METKLKRDVEKLAWSVRYHILDQLTNLGFGHAGGSLSIAELVAVLYDGVMNVDPKNPKMEERDRLVVSKGHAGPALYAILALKGFFPMEWLKTLNQNKTRLPSHCDANKTPGIDLVTGSLGQGLSVAAGLAYAFQSDKKPNYVYAIIGDGESQEGQIWEAMMAGAKYKLDHLICFLDHNKYQLDGSIADIMPLKDLEAKCRAFGWNTSSVDGHDTAQIFNAIQNAKDNTGTPSMIILNTVKGSGIDALEAMHHKCHHMRFDEESAKSCMAEVKAKLEQFK